MSRAHRAKGSVPPATPTSQWWRMAFRSDEAVVMTVDDPDDPEHITWTFPDDLDEDITPSQLRHQQPTTRMPEDGVTLLPLGESRRVNSLPEFLDVLMVGRPTDSVRWNELTAPGDHWHPAFGDRPSST